jgi:hypothetical protein
MTPYRIALLALLASISLGWSSVWADDLTGTLKKIKDSGEITIGNRESSRCCPTGQSISNAAQPIERCRVCARLRSRCRLS